MFNLAGVRRRHDDESDDWAVVMNDLAVVMGDLALATERVLAEERLK